MKNAQKAIDPPYTNIKKKQRRSLSFSVEAMAKVHHACKDIWAALFLVKNC